jgi:hypothetical protein
VALTDWRLDESARDAMEDLSDAAVGPDGRVYLLSDKSCRIGRVEEHLRPGERSVRLDAVWDLPGEIDKPEGLAITPNWITIVAVDTHSSTNNNLYFLHGLSP